MRFALSVLRLAAAAARPAPSSLAAASFRAPLPTPLLRRSFASTSPALSAPPPPSRAHSGAEAEIRDKLMDRLEAEECDVEDASGGCGSFYQIRVSSPAFIGLSTVKQHRLVNDILKEEIKGIHGLQLKTSAPPKQ